jgi:hypothetical protein
LRKGEKTMRTLIMGLIILGLLVIGAVGMGAEHEEASQGASAAVLIQQGPVSVAEGDYKQVLDLIAALSEEEQNNIQVRTLECFANLKGWVTDKDPVRKMDWWGLRIKLMYVGDTKATPLLVIFLKDPNPYMRKYAAELLGYIGDERALDDLSAVKENDNNSGVRKYATWAYKQISGGLTPMASGLPPLVTPQVQIPVTMEVAGPIAQSKRISFVNSTHEFKVIFLITLNYKKYYADSQAWADIIIVQLEDELQKRGVRIITPVDVASDTAMSSHEKVSVAQVTPEIDYVFNVAVQDIKLVQGSWATRCIVTVLVERADGQWSHTYERNNASPASAERAIDGAVYRVVEAIIADPGFRSALSQ